MSLCCSTITAARFKGHSVLNLSPASLNPLLYGPKDKERAKESKCGLKRGSQSPKKMYHFDRQVFKISVEKEVWAGNTGKWPQDLASAQQYVLEDHWPSTHTGSR